MDQEVHKCFSGVNIIMTISSVGLFNRTKIQKVLCFIFTVIVSLIRLSSLIKEIKQSIRYQRFLFIITVLSSEISFLVTFIFMLWQRGDFEKIITRMVHKLPKSDRVKLRRVSFLLLILFLMRILLSIIAYGDVIDNSSLEDKLEQYFLPPFEPFITITKILSLIKIICMDCLVCSWFVYIWLYYCNHLLVASQISLALERVTMKSICIKHRLDLKAELQNIQGMISLHHDLDRIVSFLPFIWLFRIFMSTAGFVNWQINRSENDWSQIIKIFSSILFILDVMTILLILLMIDTFQDRNEKMCRSLSNLLFVSCHNMSGVRLASHISILSSCRSTVWRFGTIDRSVILSFLASLITFNILFLQISTNSI